MARPATPGRTAGRPGAAVTSSGNRRWAAAGGERHGTGPDAEDPDRGEPHTRGAVQPRGGNVGSAPIQTALIPPAGITRTQKVRAAPHPHKRVTISRLQHGEARGSATPGVQQTPEGQGAALWRSDASAGPNAQIQSDGSAYPREDRPESGIEPIGGEPSG